VALQPNTGLDAWWQGLGDDPYADPYAMQPLSIASSEGIPAPSPIVAPAYPPEIEMPAVDARPVEQPEIEMPAQDARPTLGFPHAPEAPYESPIGAPPVLGGMQPGLGIPTSALEGFQPQLDHEQAVDDRVAGSERFSDDPMRIPTPEEAREQRISDSEKLTELPDAHETVFDAETARLGEMSPDDFYRESRMQAETERLDDQQRREEALANRRREADADQGIRVKARARAQQERDQIDADAKALAMKPNATDQDWFEEGGIGRRAGAFIVGLLGGLGKDYRGLDQINRSVDSFLAAKKADRDQQRALIGDRRMSLDARLEQEDQDWREDQAYKQAALERTLQEIETVQQSFHPEGTRAMDLAKARQGIEVELMASRIATNEALEKKNWAREKHNWDRENNQRLRDENRRKDEEHALKLQGMRAKMGGGGPGKAKPLDEIFTPEQLTAKYGPDAPVPPTGWQGTDKEYQSWLGTKGKAADVAGKVRENSPDERAGLLGVSGVEGDDGKPVLFRDAPTATRVAKKKAATENIARLLDTLIVARAKYGWSSDLLKSPEWLTAQSSMGSLIMESKTYNELGVIAGPDMDLLGKQIGTTDPTQTKDPSAGWKQFRSDAVESLNTTIRTEARPGSKPKRYEPPRTVAAKSEENTQSQNLDVWSSPLLQSKDKGIRERAASDAVAGADAFARQGSPGWLKSMAYDARARLESKAFSQEQYDKVMKSVRREWRRKIGDVDVDVAQRLGAKPLKESIANSLSFGGGDENGGVDEELFAPMGSE
jgi:hypothetical protein